MDPPYGLEIIIIKNDNSLLKKAEHFQAIGFSHGRQNDGVSCGIRVIEVKTSSFWLYTRIGAHHIQQYLKELFSIFLLIFNIYLLPGPNLFNLLFFK